MSIVAALLLLGMGDSPVTAPRMPRQEGYTRSNAELVQIYYPPLSRELGEQGIVHFLLSLDKQGRIASCAITQSSGYSRLDRATCDLMTGVKYKAVESPEGRRASSQHAGALLWSLPGSPPPAVPAMQRSGTELAKEKLICRPGLKTDSSSRYTTYCLTQSDWSRARDNVRREMRRSTEGTGSTS